MRISVENLNTADGKQKIVADLYERFFKGALPDDVFKSLGIAFTPVEVVDYIVRSVEDLLNSEFDASLGDKGVHIIDPFVGTGTFITRLLQSGIINAEDLPQKYAGEIHANEINLLAYYIAAINIEAVYDDLIKPGEYEPFEGIVLTDTFQAYESSAPPDDIWFPENNQRIARQKQLDIRVVIGNPPWSATNNRPYPSIDGRVRELYAELSNVPNQNNLYDSYVKAVRLASDWVQEGDKGGVVAFVSNGGFIDSKAFDGFRKAIADEFDTVYCYNLRGDQRTSGDISRREGGKIFGSSSRAGVAILFLVKSLFRPLLARMRGFVTGMLATTSQESKNCIICNCLGSRKLNGRPSSPTSMAIGSINSRMSSHYCAPLRMRIVHLLQVQLPRQFFAGTLGLQSHRDAWCFNSSTEKLYMK